MFVVLFGLLGVGNYTTHFFSSWTFCILWLSPWVLSKSSFVSWEEVVCGWFLCSWLGSGLRPLHSHFIGKVSVRP